uniref:Knottin scorpion toxin-like domain-containing protein n=1 Tax=Oryza brachyantha TaxID=4533 RepID=J3N6J7_ORYBR
MCLLLSAAAAAAASFHPSDADTYSTCFEVGGCTGTGCAIRCGEMGHSPAGSACRPKDTALYCCCGVDQNPPPPSLIVS